MKNLKRVLSLALTGVMLVGMMAIGASAANKDFTDADEIQHTEAVEVMSTLGVLQGKDTGAFDPKATVTRGEMAKIITVMLNGGVDPTLGSGSASMFTDTANHWARKYIEYCASMGIIAGMGDGTFGPDLPVTGGAAAKMLLVALGYDSDIFGFTGADWEINVNRIANTEAKLYEEIKNIDTSAGLSRDDTAQMAYNALEARLMVQGYDKVVSSGEISYNYGLGDQTFLNKYFDAKIFIGQMTGNSDTQRSNVKGNIYVYGQLDTDDKTATTGSERPRTATFPADFDISNLGEEVKVIFKDGKSGTENRPDKNDTIYGVFNTHSTEVINATLSDIKTGTDAPTATNKIKVGDEEYTVAAATTDPVNVVMVDYGAGSAIAVDSDGTVSATLFQSRKAAFESLSVAQTGDTVKFVCNDNGEITDAYVVHTYISYVTAVNANKITLVGAQGGSIDREGNDIYDGIAKDDVVTFTKFYNSNRDDAVYTVVKAETVEGELKGYRQNKDYTSSNKLLDNVKVGDETYKVYTRNLVAGTIANETTKTDLGTTDIGEDFILYMVNGFVGYMTQSSESMTQYALVVDFNEGELDSTFSTPRAQLLLPDNSKVTVEIHKDSVIHKTASFDSSHDNDLVAAGEGIDTGLEKGQIVRYSVVNNNLYKIEEVGTYVTSNATDGYDSDTKEFAGTVTAGTCPLFVNEAGSYKAYNIRDLKDVTPEVVGGAAMTGKYERDGRVVAAFVTLTTRPSGASSNTFYGVVSGSNGVIKDGDDFYNSYTVENDKETATVMLPTTGTNAGTLSTGTLVSFELASDNVYKNSEVNRYTGATFNATAGLATWVKEYNASDKTITYWNNVTGSASAGYTGSGTTTRALDDDCVIVYIDKDNDKGGSDIGINEFNAVDGDKNVLLVKETGTGNKVVAIFVESSSEAPIVPCVHSWNAGVEKTAATCTEDQVKTYTCTLCGATKDEAVADTATGHDFDNSTEYASDGTHHWKVCANGCGTEDTEHKATHTDSWAAATEANTEAGIAVGDHVNTCSVCEAVLAHHEVPTEAAGKVTGCTVCDGLSL